MAWVSTCASGDGLHARRGQRVRPTRAKGGQAPGPSEARSPADESRSADAAASKCATCLVPERAHTHTPRSTEGHVLLFPLSVSPALSLKILHTVPAWYSADCAGCCQQEEAGLRGNKAGAGGQALGEGGRWPGKWQGPQQWLCLCFKPAESC